MLDYKLLFDSISKGRISVLRSFCIKCPFHKTLPKYSEFINWISVRFYETDCNWAEERPSKHTKPKTAVVFSNVFLILQTCSVSSSEGRSAFGSNLLTNQSSISATKGKLGCRKFSKKQEDYIGIYFKLGRALNILV